MQKPIIGPDEADLDDDADFDDIEWELCCSAREATVAYLPLTNLDSMRAAMELGGVRVNKVQATPRS